MAPGVSGRIILHAVSAADLEEFNIERELVTILRQLLKDSTVLESHQKSNPAAALLAVGCLPIFSTLASLLSRINVRLILKSTDITIQPLTESGAFGLLGLNHRPLVVPIYM